MVKRVFCSFLLIYMGLYSVLSPVMLYAASTNGVASPWTREKAEHLARKALIGATPTLINQLFQAGSASAAVNLLFPDAVGPDRTSYNSEVTALTSSGFDFGNEGSMRKLYQLRYYRDPYEAKVKLFSLFEDIFPVNQSTTISYVDIANQQDLLYTNTLGNYKTLVKQILFNNGQTGDYAEGKFLDLLDGSNKNYPNENYSRELMQLFLMGEYKPGESKELGSVRNYEETDVAALAKILTGLRSDAVTHLVSYDATKHNTSSGVLFLSGTITSNPFSSFYDSLSGTLDLGTMQTSLLGNNGLTDNAIDYIFAQRSEAISLFLADRLFRFYIHGKPTRSELDSIAANIRANNFDMLPSVKTLLASDVLYSDTSMNSVSYKNPLELAIGTLKVLHDKDPLTFDPRIYDTELLNMLNWRPYFPGSVFGREGFDDNTKWFTAYTENQWISFATRLASTVSLGSYLYSNIVPIPTMSLSGSFAVSTSPLNTYSGALSIAGTGNIILIPDSSTASGTSFDYNGGTISLPSLTVQLGSGTLSIDQGNLDMTNSLLTVSSGSLVYSGATYPNFSGSFLINPEISLSREATVDEVLTQIEDTILSSRRLPELVKAKIRTYATTSNTGATIAFVPSNTTVQNTKIRGMIALAFASPEFILQTGYDVPPVTESTSQSPISSTTNKLVFIELSGGYDWLHGIIQKDQYATYQSLRTNSSGTIAIAPQNLTDLGDYYMNNALAFSGANGPSLKSLYDSNNLRIFNRVGTIKHSRDHDAAQKQSTSYSNTTVSEDDGAFGHIIKTEAEGSNTISLSGKRPNIFRNGNYINIGPSGAQFANYAPIPTTEKTNQLNLFRDVFATRTYPGTSGGVFKNAAKIDEVATTSVSHSGPNGAGYGNINNFKFLQSLLSAGVGKTFFMQGDGGYDTHSNQLAPTSNFDPNNVPRDLNYSVGRVVANVTTFFNAVKDTQNITIVIYSEFGRTIRVNGDLGTDHGQGGGMFVLSNNGALQSSLPQKVYGVMDLLHEKSNWLSVGIDYRSVYGKIYNALYGLSDTNYFTSMSRFEDNTDAAAPKFTLARNEFRPGSNTNNARLTVPFRIEDANFNMDYGSNFEVEYGTGFSNLKKLSQGSVNNIRKASGLYLFDVGVFSKNTPYVYRISAFDDQFRQTVLTGSLNIPDVRVGSNSTGTLISPTTDTVINKHANRVISGTLPLSGSTSITLANNGTGSTSTITARDGITINLGTGTTQVDSISSVSGSTTWNGGFILGEAVDKNTFLSSGSLTSMGIPLSGMNIEKIIKVGADTLGVQMNLNQSVNLNVSGMTSTIPYSILRSEDGLTWTSIGTGGVSNGIVTFPTNTFSYFALVSATPMAPPVVSPPVIVVTPPISSGGSSGGGGSSTTSAPTSTSSINGSSISAPINNSTPGIVTNNTLSGSIDTKMSTFMTGSLGELFSRNLIISSYAFPNNERIPQKVAAELNFIVTNMVRVIDRRAEGDRTKKIQYYKTLDSYMLNYWGTTTNTKEKRIIEYLRVRLAIMSKGLIKYEKTPVSIGTSEKSEAPDERGINTPSPISTGDISSLGINLSHSAFIGYDFTKNKRFPRAITIVLNGFVQTITNKIDSKNLSADNRNSLYKQIFSVLKTEMKIQTDIKEQKIIRYIGNHLYIKQQEGKIIQ